MTLDVNLSTKLNNRVLWFDGDSTVDDLQLIYDCILSGSTFDHLKVTTITPEIKEYNKINDENKITIKTELKDFKFDWNIPEEYERLNVKQYIYEKLEAEIDSNSFSSKEIEERISRVKLELKLWESNNLILLLKTLVFVVDEFKKKRVVWGTGRGSSCCCYILYLIGLHDVDSIKFELEIGEFFRN